MTDYKKYEPFFNAWYITKKIGSGNFGDVFEVERKEFGRVYKSAIKIISIPKSDDEKRSMKEEISDDDSLTAYYDSAVKRISDEVAIMSEVRGHSNIVSYEDHEVIKHEDGVGYDIIIRMELLTLLTDYQKTHSFNEQDVIKLGIDLCNALDICAMKNIIHRDIKPGNIFVSDTGDFKLGDFGIARTIEATTSELSKKGTYSYMAPEVYMGKSYDARADIYSLGLVMYTLLNKNRLPFYPLPPEPITYTNKESAIRRRLGGEKLPAPTSCGMALCNIVLKACAYNPNNRFKDAAEFRNALEALSNNNSTDYDKTMYMTDVNSGDSTMPSQVGTMGSEYLGQEQDGSQGVPLDIQSFAGSDNTGMFGMTNDKRWIIAICAAVAALLLCIIAALTLFHTDSKATDEPLFKQFKGVTMGNDEFSSDNIESIKLFNSSIKLKQVDQTPGSDNMKGKKDGGEKRSPEKDGVDVLLYLRNDNDEDIVGVQFKVLHEDTEVDNIDGKGDFKAYGLVRHHDSNYMYAKIKIKNKYAYDKYIDNSEDFGVKITKIIKKEKKDVKDTMTFKDVMASRNGSKNTKGWQYYNIVFKKGEKEVFDSIHDGQPYVLMLKDLKNYPQDKFNTQWGAGIIKKKYLKKGKYDQKKAIYNPGMSVFKAGKYYEVVVFDKKYLGIDE